MITAYCTGAACRSYQLLTLAVVIDGISASGRLINETLLAVMVIFITSRYAFCFKRMRFFGIIQYFMVCADFIRALWSGGGR